MTPPHADRYASSYVLWSELACHDALKTPYPLDWRHTILPRLLCVFEAHRAIRGKPMPITSGYRTPDYNRLIGGAKRSQHCLGTAIDYEPPEGVSIEECYRDLVGLAQSRPDLGVGYVAGYAVCVAKPRGQIHLDVRRGPFQHEWIPAPEPDEVA